MLKTAEHSLFQNGLPKLIPAGWKTFVIGVFPVRFGGGTGFLCGIVMLAAKLLHRALILINVRNAVVLAAGHCGFGLGATPTAIANMQAITERFGPSHMAFLVVPMVGAFFIDIVNALVIKLYLMLPMFA